VSLLSGIYYPVPLSNTYSLAADIRVDRFNDHPTFPATDFAMQLTFAQLGTNLYTAPQVGIYASTFTETWRLFLIPSDGNNGADIDLGLAVTRGLWYRVQLDFDSIDGGWHAQIADAGSGVSLVNQTGTFSNWTPSAGLFDGVAFIEGEGSPDTTIGNLALVDNINVTATPEPATTGLFLAGILFGELTRRNRRQARRRRPSSWFRGSIR
jgi:PEP-CTERM motif